MKTCLSVLLFALLAVLLHTEYAAAREVCHPANCLSPEKCDSEVPGAHCSEQNTNCCSIVKLEHRTLCHHHGGECMNNCNSMLQRFATNCPDGKVCCVLV